MTEGSTPCLDLLITSCWIDHKVFKLVEQNEEALHCPNLHHEVLIQVEKINSVIEFVLFFVYTTKTFPKCLFVMRDHKEQKLFERKHKIFLQEDDENPVLENVCLKTTTWNELYELFPHHDRFQGKNPTILEDRLELANLASDIPQYQQYDPLGFVTVSTLVQDDPEHVYGVEWDFLFILTLDQFSWTNLFVCNGLRSRRRFVFNIGSYESQCTLFQNYFLLPGSDLRLNDIENEDWCSEIFGDSSDWGIKSALQDAYHKQITEPEKDDSSLGLIHLYNPETYTRDPSKKPKRVFVHPRNNVSQSTFFDETNNCSIKISMLPHWEIISNLTHYSVEDDDTKLERKYDKKTGDLKIFLPDEAFMMKKFYRHDLIFTLKYRYLRTELEKDPDAFVLYRREEPFTDDYLEDLFSIDFSPTRVLFNLPESQIKTLYIFDPWQPIDLPQLFGVVREKVVVVCFPHTPEHLLYYNLISRSEETQYLRNTNHYVLSEGGLFLPDAPSSGKEYRSFGQENEKLVQQISARPSSTLPCNTTLYQLDTPCLYLYFLHIVDLLESIVTRIRQFAVHTFWTRFNLDAYNLLKRSERLDQKIHNHTIRSFVAKRFGCADLADELPNIETILSREGIHWFSVQRRPFNEIQKRVTKFMLPGTPLNETTWLVLKNFWRLYCSSIAVDIDEEIDFDVAKREIQELTISRLQEFERALHWGIPKGVWVHMTDDQHELASLGFRFHDKSIFDRSLEPYLSEHSPLYLSLDLKMILLAIFRNLYELPRLHIFWMNQAKLFSPPPLPCQSKKKRQPEKEKKENEKKEKEEEEDDEDVEPVNLDHLHDQFARKSKTSDLIPSEELLLYPSLATTFLLRNHLPSDIIDEYHYDEFQMLYLVERLQNEGILYSHRLGDSKRITQTLLEIFSVQLINFIPARLAKSIKSYLESRYSEIDVQIWPIDTFYLCYQRDYVSITLRHQSHHHLNHCSDLVDDVDDDHDVSSLQSTVQVYPHHSMIHQMVPLNNS
jgi:hypothetical protein